MNAINLVDQLIARALYMQASDIHLESSRELVRVRLRIDGILYDDNFLDHTTALQVMSRIKILSHLDIAERRMPQDGKFLVDFEQRDIDCRVSSFPGIHGEKIVIRLLDKKLHTLQLEHLGMCTQKNDVLTSMIHKQHGFILVAGPTGSGKTTTLYAALSKLNTPDRNIITLEDPVEYEIPGITQGQIHSTIGFTFAKGMRAMLRQDPDVLMIGEIRDQETAHIAIESALTGHMILSTVHTNSALSVVMRLLDIGIEPFLLTAALTGVVAQRLARRLCQHCIFKDNAQEYEKRLLDTCNLEHIVHRSRGCDLCYRLGTKGRIGIFELISIDDILRKIIMTKPSIQQLYQIARANNIPSLIDDAKQKFTQGLISFEDFAKIVA